MRMKRLAKTRIIPSLRQMYMRSKLSFAYSPPKHSVSWFCATAACVSWNYTYFGQARVFDSPRDIFESSCFGFAGFCGYTRISDSGRNGMAT